MENFGYLFAAYSIIFAAILLYVVFIGQRQSRLELELHAMEARLKSLLANDAQASAGDEQSRA
jgi:CcmD family protein